MKRLLAVGSAVLAIVLTAAFVFDGTPFWPFGGHDIRNTRNAGRAVMIGPDNVADLTPQWIFETAGDVSATASVDATSVYFPDWGGYVYSLDRRTGAVNWSLDVAEVTGIPGNKSRNTPAIFGDMLIFGDLGGTLFGGARLIAVSRLTGEVQWVTQIDQHPASVVTQSPVVFGNRVYVGVSSMEELFEAVVPGYACCTFRGSLVALDVLTGEIVWKTYTTPDVPGYSGNSIWGPTAAIDPARNSIFVTTGNNYTVPDAELECVAANEGDPDAIAACSAPDNFFDAILALDLTTGAIKWATKALPFDAWTASCLFGLPGCASPAGPDLDFGEGPALFTIDRGANRLDVVGAGQKSGVYWVLDRETGNVVWTTKAGPGGLVGGMIWGSATDGERIYTAEANTSVSDWYTLGSATPVTYGGWSALDARTGEVLWQTPDPGEDHPLGPVTLANGIAYVCSMDADGHMYALDAGTGEVLWSFASGASCNAGAAVADGMVYWGSGYAAVIGFPPFYNAGPNNQFFAFGLSD